MSSFEDGLLAALQQLFAPVTAAVAGPAAFGAFLSELGWQVDAAWASNPASSVAEVSGALASITNAIDALAADNASAVPGDVANVVSAISSLGAPGSLGTLPAPLSSSAFWSAFPQQLYQYLVFAYLRDNVPVVFGVLRFLGVLTAADVEAQPNATPPRIAYRQVGVDWTAIRKVIADPQHFLQTIYGLGGPSFDPNALLSSTADLFALFPIYRYLAASPVAIPASTSLLALFYDTTTLQPGQYSMLSTALPFFMSGGAPSIVNAKVGLVALPIPAVGSQSPPATGIALFPLVTGSLDQSVNVSDNVVVTLNGDFQSIPVIAEMRPGPSPNVIVTQALGSTTSFDAEARVDAKAATPWYLVGAPGETSVQLTQAHLRLVASGPVSDVTYKIEVGFDHAQLLVDFSQSDSFIQAFLGGAQQSFDLSIALLWSNKTGIGFGGQTNLQIDIPVHLNLFGIVSIDTVSIGLTPGSSGVSLPLAVSGSFQLGPIGASVDRLGALVQVTESPDHQGTFGDVDLQLGFKPPEGLGADLDLGPVSGGGYISYDDTKKEYAGILQASFGMPLAAIDLELIGILDTVMPDGSKGYSFLIIVTVDFPPIQVGFGFTLNGVGGLAGINRSMVLDALQNAVHNGTADQILFPVDPITHAADIISTLSAVFPPAAGRYTFGPMLEMGWGTPQLVDFQLGLIIEVPDPIRLAILGLIQVGLPTLELPDPDLLLVDINIDVVGTIDFDQKLLVIEATIYDSRVVEFALSGDMYLQLGWGATPAFVLSLGGFNPHFQPPPGIPALRRLSIGLDAGSASVSLTAYLAVTSNTFQCGADLEARASAGSFSVHGYLGFDALFIFHPFSFQTEMRAGVDVLHGSSVLFQVSLDLQLSGPKPWNAQGSASFKVLFASVSVSVSFTIGDAGAADPLPQIAVLPLLSAALGNSSNWSALLSDDLSRSVTLTAPPGSPGQVIVHPMGRLSVDERVVPLDYAISKFGNDAPSDGATFSIAAVQFNGTALTDGQDLTDATDYFARAQFVSMADGDKLAARSFELFHSGKQMGATTVQAPAAQAQLTEEFTLYYVDDVELAPTRVQARQYTRPLDLTMALLGQSAAAHVPARNKGDAKFAVPGAKSPIAVNDPLYVVVSTADLTIDRAVSPASGVTQAQATASLQAYLAANPSAAGTLNVVALYEAAA